VNLADHPEEKRALRINFSKHGNARPFQQGGWSRPEGGHTWSTGTESVMEIPCPEFRRRCIFYLSGWPHTQPDLLPSQRIHMTVNGVRVARLTMTKNQTLVGGIPRRTLQGCTALKIELHHPDAARPSSFPNGNALDTRALAVSYKELLIEELDPDAARLSVQIRAALKKPPAERSFVTAPALKLEQAKTETAQFLPNFQSLGDDCEFGIVQREAGVDPLGLFRFCLVSLTNVTNGIIRDFAGIADEDHFEIVEYTHDAAHDYMGRENTYGMLYHTRRYPGKDDPNVLKTQEMQRLKFMARKFLEDIELPDRIFVAKRKQGLAPDEIAKLLALLHRRGQSQLLWVSEAPPGIAPGSAERLAEKLVAAYVDRIDVAPLKDVSVESWITACRSAWALLGNK
jgi:hypothetical protein